MCRFWLIYFVGFLEHRSCCFPGQPEMDSIPEPTSVHKFLRQTSWNFLGSMFAGISISPIICTIASCAAQMAISDHFLRKALEIEKRQL